MSSDILISEGFKRAYTVPFTIYCLGCTRSTNIACPVGYVRDVNAEWCTLFLQVAAASLAAAAAVC